MKAEGDVTFVNCSVHITAYIQKKLTLNHTRIIQTKKEQVLKE